MWLILTPSRSSLRMYILKKNKKNNLPLRGQSSVASYVDKWREIFHLVHHLINLIILNIYIHVDTVITYDNKEKV